MGAHESERIVRCGRLACHVREFVRQANASEHGPSVSLGPGALESACDLRVAFALDTCHREVMAWCASTSGISGEMVRDLMLNATERRFGGAHTPQPIQWLSDNGRAVRGVPAPNREFHFCASDYAHNLLRAILCAHI